LLLQQLLLALNLVILLVEQLVEACLGLLLLS